MSHYEKKLAANPGLHHHNPTYAAMIHSLDENVGRVLQRLDERGLADRTVVVFTSDNGGYINDYNKKRVTDNFPLRSGKGSLYEGGVRVPLIVRWPGVTPRGAVSAEPVAVMDLFPTLARGPCAGEGPRAEALDSLSLTPLLRDPSRPPVARCPVLPLPALLRDHVPRRCHPRRRLEAARILRGQPRRAL